MDSRLEYAFSLVILLESQTDGDSRSQELEQRERTEIA